MLWTGLGFAGAANVLHGAGEGEELEPCQRITGRLHVRDATLGQGAERPQGCGGVTIVHGLGSGTAEMELGGRVVAVATWTGPPLRCDHPLLLEVAHHPGGQTDRLAGRANAREFVSIVALSSVWHDGNLPQFW